MVVIQMRLWRGWSIGGVRFEWSSSPRTTPDALHPFSDANQLGRRVSARNDGTVGSRCCRRNGVVDDEVERTRTQRTWTKRRHSVDRAAATVHRWWSSRDRLHGFGNRRAGERLYTVEAEPSWTTAFPVVQHRCGVCRWWRATTEFRINNSCILHTRHCWELQYSGTLMLHIQMKKRSEETQTLQAGCSKAEPKISPHCRPPSQGHGMAKV